MKQTLKKYASHIRLWHWLNAIVICGSLLTVLLNSTIFDVRENTAFIKGELAQAGASVSDKQARAAAHGLEDSVWQLHIYFGYALAGLFLYRIVFELLRKKESGFFNSIKATLKLYLTTRVASNRYELGIKVLYLVFYVTLFIMVTSGLSIAFDENLGLTNSFSHTLKEIHGFCMYIVLGFIVLHIGGIFLAERSNKKGIVSDMINGGKLDE